MMLIVFFYFFFQTLPNVVTCNREKIGHLYLSSCLSFLDIPMNFLSICFSDLVKIKFKLYWLHNKKTVLGIYIVYVIVFASKFRYMPALLTSKNSLCLPLHFNNS